MPRTVLRFVAEHQGRNEESTEVEEVEEVFQAKVEKVFQAAVTVGEEDMEDAGTPGDQHHPVSPVKVLTAVTVDRSFKLSSSLQGRKRCASLPQVH